MIPEQLREQLQVAADRFTDELVEYFGQMLESVMEEVTHGMSEAKARRAGSPTFAKKLPREVALTAKTKIPNSNRAKGAPKAQLAKAMPQAAHATRSLRSGRRSNKELDLAATRVEKLLKSEKRGLRIEEINRRLGTSTRELMRPIKHLLSSERIRRRGQRRSTTYFA